MKNTVFKFIALWGNRAEVRQKQISRIFSRPEHYRNWWNGGIIISNPDKKAERWKETKARCRLSDEAVTMAKEMGLNPLSLIKNIPNKNQLWKAPVEDWVRDMYEKRHVKSKKK